MTAILIANIPNCTRCATSKSEKWGKINSQEEIINCMMWVK